MRSLYLDTLKIHDSVSDTDFWLQGKQSGFDFPKVRMNNYDKPGENGSVVSASFYGSRLISLQGVLKGATPAIFEANRIAFMLACAQKKDSNGYPTPTRITFTTLANNTYYVDAYVRDVQIDYDEINYARYMINLETTDPYIYSSTTASTIITRAIGGGAIVPFVVPVTLAASSGGTGIALNNGNGTSYPILTLTGQLTNPYIANTTVGKIMQLTYTIATGDIVTINMVEKTILLNGTTSLLSAKTVDSEWWALVAGSNNLLLSTGTTADAGTLTVSYAHAYLGV